MKKIVLSIVILVLTGLTAQKASAQLWLMTDAGVFFTKNLVGQGINLRGAWHYGDFDRNMVTLGGGYNLIGGSNFEIVVYDTNGVSFDTVTSALVVNMISIDADYRRYFFQTDADDYFGFYGLVGTSLWMVNTKLNLGPFADTLYAPLETVKLTQSSMSVRMPLGFGIDWTVRGRFWWYFEAKIEVPFTQVDNDFIGNDVGVSYHINTGARILLWDLW